MHILDQISALVAVADGGEGVGGAGSMGSWGSGGVRTEEMNIGGIPPCGHTLATHRGLSLAWGVYPLLCRDTEDYTPSVVCPPCVATHGGYTPPTTQGS